MALSKVRIDLAVGKYNLRGYDEAGDDSIPLGEEQRKYKIVGTVDIKIPVSTVSATLGDMKDYEMQRDFDRDLMSRGVKSIQWERHDNGRTTYYTRELRAQ